MIACDLSSGADDRPFAVTKSAERASDLALLSNVQRFSADDGPGIRTTIFLKGCNLRCLWCHNPECINEFRELQYDEKLCVACGICRSVCPSGALQGQGKPVVERNVCVRCGICAGSCKSGALSMVGRNSDVASLIETIDKDRPYYDVSGGGVTVSGGEPLLQIDFLERLLTACGERGFLTAVDTAGNVPFECFRRISPWTDLFLYDIKLVDREMHRRFTGVYNDQILSNMRKLDETGCRTAIRIPVIRDVNDSAEEAERFAQFFSGLRHVASVELLPYHSYGAGKYRLLGKDYPAQLLAEPSHDALTHLAAKIEGIGHKVLIA